MNLLQTFHKIAKYYERKGDFLRASECIGEAEKLVHIRHPDYHLLTTKVKSWLNPCSFILDFYLVENIT